jgi:hypothetical protein
MKKRAKREAKSSRRRSPNLKPMSKSIIHLWHSLY